MIIKHNAPFVKDKITTSGIMNHLCIALGVLYLFGIYKASLLGSAYVIHTILLLLVSVAASFLCETVYALLTKQNVIEFYKQSFPLVTPLIFVLTITVNTSLFAAFVSTAIAVVFGKLVFGGFGQNIFNPAAIARGIIAAAFATSLNTELITSATPATTISTVNWLVNSAELSVIFQDFGGWLNLLIGTYGGSIGETSTLLIILCAIYLVYKRVIDYKIPLFYVLTIFFGSLVFSAASGNFDVRFAVFNLLTGGVLFGAVFMMTDPVTSPVTVSGKILFAVLAGFVTLIIRYHANAPEGVLYSILIANIFVPLIERLFDARQLHVLKRNTNILLCSGLIVLLLTGLVGANSQKTKEYKTILRPVFDRGASLVLKDEDFKSYKAKLIEMDKQDGLNHYIIQTKGYGLLDPDGVAEGHDYGYNVIEVFVDQEKNTVSKVIFKEFGDTAGIGDKAMDEAFLSQFVDIDLTSEVDVVSAATYTSKSVMAAIVLALKGGVAYPKGASSELKMSDTYKSYLKNVTIESEGNAHRVSVRGYGLIDPDGIAAEHGDYKENIFTIVLDNGKVKSVVVEQFGDTNGIGDAILNQDYLDHFTGKTLSEEVDLISGATYSSMSVAAAVTAVLDKEATHE